MEVYDSQLFYFFLWRASFLVLSQLRTCLIASTFYVIAVLLASSTPSSWWHNRYWVCHFTALIHLVCRPFSLGTQPSLFLFFHKQWFLLNSTLRLQAWRADLPPLNLFAFPITIELKNSIPDKSKCFASSNFLKLLLLNTPMHAPMLLPRQNNKGKILAVMQLQYHRNRFLTSLVTLLLVDVITLKCRKDWFIPRDQLQVLEVLESIKFHGDGRLQIIIMRIGRIL